jgi:DNA repair protein RecO (recombination protein O)
MPLEQSEGFILRTYNIAEQDKIVVLFSRDKGLLKGVAKGARKFGNRFGSSLEPLSHVRMFYYEKEGKELVTISNSDLIESFFDIQKDLKTTYTLSYFSELIDAFFPARSKDDVLFRLLRSTLKSLQNGSDLDFTSLYFEAWILKISGILPDFKYCRKCGKVSDETHWLSHKNDGILCSRCVSGNQIDIPPNFNDFLIWIKKNPPPKNSSSSVPFPSELLVSFRKILRTITVFNMERVPKSLRFIE